jgi:PHD/YefM family antitoxin component YafN of YafNO toxin-antitoxin module
MGTKLRTEGFHMGYATHLCRRSAVLVSVDDWASIQETVYLLRESIREALSASVDECSKELDW